MILVTGGAGYIGSHANKLLNRRGYETVVFDNLSYGHREFAKWGAFVHGDLRDREQVKACFRRYPVEAVMHFAAFTYVGESVKDPGKYYRNNLANTINLLEAMRESGTAKMIFSSSCATYGVPEKVPMAEDHPQKPVNPYGKSKLMVEEILKDYDKAHGLKHVNLRYFNAAGADPEGEIGEWHDPETHLVPLVIDAALGRREFIKIFGNDYPTQDGTCIRDYIHVADLADAHLKALEYLGGKGESAAFNLGNSRGHSVREVIGSVCEKAGKRIRVIEGPRREGDPPILVSESKRAKEILGWVPRYGDLETIIETALQWHGRN